MEIDISIRGATLEEARGIFSRAPEGTEYKIVTVPKVDHREENLARAVIPGDELTGNLPAETPPNQKKGAADVVKKKPKREAACDKYGIPPSLCHTDKKKYGRIYWRCRTKGMTYDEALKLEEKTAETPEKTAKPVIEKQAAAKKTKQPGHSKKCPYCEIVMNTRLLHFHVKKEHAGEYDKSVVSAYIAGKNIIAPLKDEPDPFPEPSPVAALDVAPDIKIDGAEELVDKMPEERPPTTGDPGKVYRNPRNPGPLVGIPEEFKVGIHVKQIKPFQDRIVPQVGIVTARLNGLVEVNFGGTRYVKISPDCLEVV